ncbi:MAG TPA: CDP-alcohol phosphatidyltransferase family protein [Actinomycetota bacterium]|nr:CDP-alcohol phosphatidyltransferase family protein [Actinomycetota bacterium]
MLNQKIRVHWDRYMRPVGRAVARTGVSPDAITLGGVAVQGYAAYLILEGHLFLAALASTFAALSDVFDGAVAKAQNRAGKFGALLDSTTDRLGDALVFLPIAWLYGVSPDIVERDEPWVAVVALVALVASFLVSYVKARAESLGYRCDVGIAERAERLIAIILALAFDVVPVVITILAALSIVTFVQRLLYVRAQDSRAS